MGGGPREEGDREEQGCQCEACETLAVHGEHIPFTTGLRLSPITFRGADAPKRRESPTKG
ncbi:hypothetical protein GCM10010214_58010 [Streptomyces abikoensis]|nr:hypothetical protein GCM10010214_58010 [Streptomyces abikoensis]